MMEAARTSETLVNFYQTTRCYNPEDSNLHTHRRENFKSYNIKMDLREIGFGDVDWIQLAQDRDRWRALVNTVMNLRVP
jgi:hypothetical protein